nr:MAG TPA: hypothetical protein [Bacteriophage sp.]
MIRRIQEWRTTLSSHWTAVRKTLLSPSMCCLSSGR